MNVIKCVPLLWWIVTDHILRALNRVAGKHFELCTLYLLLTFSSSFEIMAAEY
jgi:hypothetical protein